MSRDLTNLYIDETFEFLLQKSGSEVQNGLGVRQDFLDVSASYAQTASYALNVPAFDTGSLLVTASVSDATLTFTKGDSSTFDVTVNNVESSSYAVSSSHALIADIALEAVQSTEAANTIITVRNVSGGEIPKGTPLFVTDSGTSSTVVGVIPADASDHDLMPATAIAAETIPNNQNGIGLIDGLITGVPTSAFQNGDEVYVAVGGGFTNVAPTGSARVQHLGNVTKIHPSNGAGVIKMSGEDRHNPNLQEGYVWVGDSTNGEPIAIPTSSLSVANAVSSSYALTASYALNAGAGDGFPYTGSAGISGSLDVVGPITSQTFGTIALTGDSPGIDRNILDFTGADFSVIRSDSGMVIDNTSGTGSISVFTNGNMQYEPQGDLDFYTPTGNINLTGNRGIFTAQDTFNLTSNTTDDFQGIALNAPNVRINLSRTGSGAGDFALSAPGFGGDTPGMLLGLGTGSYGDNPTVANMLFTGDDAFFSALGNFYIKNVFNDTGSITVWSESDLELRGDTSVRITGDSFANPNDPIDITIQGSTFMDSYTSGIMAFQPQIGTYTRVSQFQRAFVETPLVVNNQGTIEVQTGATLKVINEL